ncbi:alanine:cation symporter family protein [Labedella endophytica]|uniref:Alanine:cation symporter family protein n=2 Tax=Labedella endophytica TaxID=1523160 RepID=A0A433JUU7_9MICO|nr:alanine:cation symporter family protein [Labedella endophytica]
MDLYALLQDFFLQIDAFTWGWALIPMLVVFGIIFTVSTKFIQLRYFGRMWRVIGGGEKVADPDQISARQALVVSIGGRVGGGNIAGVAVAITLGGPGAVFWMWAIALVGMATSLIESTLAQAYKRRMPDGSFRGGPATYIRHGLGKSFNWLVVIYAVCLLLSFALGFNAFQANTIAGAAENSLGIDRWITGIVMAAIAGFIVYGSIQRIAKVADVIVPVMAFVYLLLALIVIAVNVTEVPAMIGTIVANAFGFESAVAGGIGAAIANGLRRGLFSNEAGLGSAPNVAATAYVKHPVSQGITQMLSVFVDTILICSATAFMILLSGVYQPGTEEIDGIVLTQNALADSLGSWTLYVLTFAILLFSFSSIMYNYYLGETALRELTPSKIATHVLRLAVIAIVLMGAIAPGATAVFFFSDPLMGLLALANLTAILMLLPTALRIVKDYTDQLKSGIDKPVFDPSKFADLDLDATAWEDADVDTDAGAGRATKAKAKSKRR